MKRSAIGTVIVCCVMVVSSCGLDNRSATDKDKAATDAGLSKLQNAQPVHQYDYSQMRQTVIDVEDAQAKGTQTTSFWFSRGAGGQGNPLGWCPSIGFPVPATAQLTNPQQTQGDHGAVISQAESTGVFTGDSSGTYVVCVGNGGKPFFAYVEADVITIGGPAEWRDGKIQQTGDPTIAVNGKK